MKRLETTDAKPLRDPWYSGPVYWGIAFLMWVLVWTGDAIAHALMEKGESLLSAIFSPAGPEAVSRLTTLIPVIAFAVILRRALLYQDRVKDELRRVSFAHEEAQRIAHVGHWDWDIVRGSLRWSDEVYRIFGLQPQSFGATYDAFLEFVHPDDRSLVEEGVRLHLEEDIPYSVEHRVVRPDGEIRYVHEKGQVERAPDGTPLRMLGTVHDTTRLTRARQEQDELQAMFQEARRMQSIGIVVGGIAHDFNNLLTPILGRISLIQRRLPDDSELVEHLASIERSAIRAAELIRQLISYAGRAQLRMRPTKFAAQLRDILSAAQSTLLEDITIVLDAARQDWVINIDPDYFESMVTTLLANSVEAIGNGEGRIVVKLDAVEIDPGQMPELRGSRSTRAGKYAMLEFRDDGPGMDAKTLEAAFEPFVTTKEEGRGLGLAALAGIMKAHGGLVGLESTPGEGAIVRLYFPLSE